MDRPSIYEFVGGAETLDRLTSVFYDRVRADPLLAPVFVNFTDEHARNVAIWLGEVFGGPPTFTAEHGGHHGLLIRHLGLGITEEQRARWADLMVECAGEVLPADELLQRRFAEYIQWGTTIAREVSGPGQEVGDDPGAVPRWGWDGLGS